MFKRKYLLYILIVIHCCPLWATKNDSMFYVKKRWKPLPKGYSLDDELFCSKILKRIFDKDSLPEKIKHDFEEELTEKLGVKWFDIFQFVRCDILIPFDSLNLRMCYGTDESDTSYKVWLKYKLDWKDLIFSMMYDNIGECKIGLKFPNVVNDSTKLRIFSLDEVMQIVKKMGCGNRIIKLYLWNLTYNEECDIMEWWIKYSQRCHILFNRRRNWKWAIINAHTGKITYWSGSGDPPPMGNKWPCK